MPQDSAINDLREKRGLRNQFPHQVRDILLTFRRKCLLITRTAAEGNHDDFSLPLRNSGSGKHSGAEKRATHGDTGGAAQKLAAREA
jgi:hypothetical protein